MSGNAEDHWFDPLIAFANFVGFANNGCDFSVANELHFQLGKYRVFSVGSRLSPIGGGKSPIPGYSISIDGSEWMKPRTVNNRQKEVIALLDKLIERKKSRHSVFNVVAGHAMQVPIRTHMLANPGPMSVSIYGRISPSSIRGWYSYLIAELIAQGLDKRLFRCGLTSCSKFVLGAKARGPAQKYCSESHGSQARMARKRLRDKYQGSMV